MFEVSARKSDRAKFCEECEVEVPRIPGAFLRGEQFYTDAIGR